MSITKKLLIPIIIAAICAIIISITSLFKIQAISGISSIIGMFGILLTAFALLVGVVNTLLKQGQAVLKRKENWLYSLWLFFLICFMLVIGLVPPIGEHPWFKLVFDSLQRPIDTAMYALMPCYMMWLAYKGFRIKGVESLLFVLSAFFLMMVYAPIGNAIWPGLPAIGNWIKAVPGMAASRGIMIGVGLGLVFLLVRVVLGKEKAIAGG